LMKTVSRLISTADKRAGLTASRELISKRKIDAASSSPDDIVLNFGLRFGDQNFDGENGATAIFEQSPERAQEIRSKHGPSIGEDTMGLGLIVETSPSATPHQVNEFVGVINQLSSMASDASQGMLSINTTVEPDGKTIFISFLATNPQVPQVSAMIAASQVKRITLDLTSPSQKSPKGRFNFEVVVGQSGTEFLQSIVPLGPSPSPVTPFSVLGRLQKFDFFVSFKEIDSNYFAAINMPDLTNQSTSKSFMASALKPLMTNPSVPPVFLQAYERVRETVQKISSIQGFVGDAAFHFAAKPGSLDPSTPPISAFALFPSLEEIGIAPPIVGGFIQQ